jgi:vancomycin permeability regulator SanA
MIWLKRLVLAAVVLAALLVAPTGWLHYGSSGHVRPAGDAPAAPVVIVFGAQLAPGGTQPRPFLRGRLDTAAELVRAGRAKVVLVSGDAHGSSGNEIAAMTAYLVGQGVPAERIVGDGDGLDSYDTCRRARDVYGIRKALLVSQRFHLPRAVTLCRGLGVDADGVPARCDDCRTSTLALNRVRELPAAWKAALDRLRDRSPAVMSPRSDQVTTALTGTG